jgi:uroporphyrin-III C-methyltransferase
MRAGRDPQSPAAVIAAATTSAERILVSTLQHVAQEARTQAFEPPAIVVIGDIVTVRDRLLGDPAAADRGPQ